jgi:AAA+ superfamily predicted ATPase
MKLLNYLRAGYPGIAIVSPEESRVENEIRNLAAVNGYSLLVWTHNDGVVDIANQKGLGAEGDPIEALACFPEEGKTILLMEDVHLFFQDAVLPSNPGIIRALKDAFGIIKSRQQHVIILGCRHLLPPELEREIVVIEYSLPSPEDFRAMVERIAERNELPVPQNIGAVVDALGGLTTQAAENAAALSVIETGGFDPEVIAREKVREIAKTGVLQVVESRIKPEDIGGNELMLEWVRRRAKIFTDRDAAKNFGLPAPRGMFQVGVPGGGKSMMCKATASILGGLPLLRLDFGAIFDSLVGSSEARLREALAIADACAPCVLWIDEIEKGTSSGGGDGGTTERVIGTFLQWMNDKTSAVFVVATANQVHAMKPELLRKGRFDEMFFIDLPTTRDRENIWRIHLRKNLLHVAHSIDVRRLAAVTAGWTGAEIESLVIESLYVSFDTDEAVDTSMLLDLIGQTTPLSQANPESVEFIRNWAVRHGVRRAAAPEVVIPAKSKTAVRKIS